MARTTDILLEGHPELMRKLKRLPVQVQNRVMKQAVRKALDPIVRAARHRAPRLTGQLRRSMGKKVILYKRSGTVWGGVGPRRGFMIVRGRGRKHDPSRVAHLVEFGHAGRHPAPPHPFLHPALKAERSKALDILAQQVEAGIEKEARR